MPTFTIGETDFLLDGEPHRILSGAIHYFRVHPDQWAERIHAARLMGLNSIETYVAWNAHEPRRGEWDASGALDLGRFLDLVAAEGMHAIVRPGPYICAEWHNGGLPVWLTGMRDVALRQSDPDYLAEVTRYLDNVYEIVAPRQIGRGGNVVLVQIENEYGAYGNDKEYLAELVRVTRAAGITVPLTTVDQPTPQMLRDGSLPGLHLTGSFGSRSAERLATLREHQPTGPLMCSEFWDGWFDWWGGIHHTTDAAAAASELETLLAAGASVNFYMVHGGTNFGLTNGANDKGRYLPLVTSYDYDAPIDEAGSPTAKFFAFRDVIAKYAPVPDEVPPPVRSAPEVSVALEPYALTLPPALEETFEEPPSFDGLGHLSALVRYETVLPEAGLLAFDEVRDRAWVSVDDRPVGILDRTRGERALVVPAGRLSLLVEEQGRVNYDARLGEPKGIVGVPTLEGQPLRSWIVTPIEVAALASQAATAPVISREESTTSRPAALRGSFHLAESADLFLDAGRWGKGFVFVNGFFLGRYWANGPQRTLYVPAPVTRSGPNTVAVVELEPMVDLTANFVTGPLLGPVEE
ncbi:glycoside hydrolase family 35 protein [Microbacterium terricola]|uniref:Beta-galactosidase n=1 Tax=Microbacterium terricola TaxID=344163 RepID=A0ABM8E2U3_9MICO|nr:glycoside hydrolase family 35 protein [Microbacterium terricola]UYK41650.1 beta-galactosidase [Microbacterium terricola]BDV32294.1 beta-galactosidase [Microbacterium terricola]